MGAGDLGSMYFGVETFFLGCILAMRVHVDHRCGGFTPKVHSCFQGGLAFLSGAGGGGTAFAVVGVAGLASGLKSPVGEVNVCR